MVIKMKAKTYQWKQNDYIDMLVKNKLLTKKQKKINNLKALIKKDQDLICRRFEVLRNRLNRLNELTK